MIGMAGYGAKNVQNGWMSVVQTQLKIVQLYVVFILCNWFEWILSILQKSSTKPSQPYKFGSESKSENKTEVLGLSSGSPAFIQNLEIVQRTHPGLLVGTRACEVPAILWEEIKNNLLSYKKFSWIHLHPDFSASQTPSEKCRLVLLHIP